MRDPAVALLVATEDASRWAPLCAVCGTPSSGPLLPGDERGPDLRLLGMLPEAVAHCGGCGGRSVLLAGITKWAKRG